MRFLLISSTLIDLTKLTLLQNGWDFHVSPDATAMSFGEFSQLLLPMTGDFRVSI